MKSFAFVGLLAALFTTGATAGPYKRQDPSDTPSSVTFSFSDIPPAALPSGTGVPYPVPTGGQGSGGPILICRPVNSSTYPDSPNDNNTTLSDIPPTPTSSLPAPTFSASARGDGPKSGGLIYICHPADSTAPPSGSAAASDAPSFSLPSPTGAFVPQAVPTDGQGSGGSVYLQCRPVQGNHAGDPSGSPSDSPNDATPSGPAPTSDPSATPSYA